MKKRKKWLLNFMVQGTGDDPFFQNPKTIMRFPKDSDSLAYIPTPMGMQEFIIQTSHYQVDGQKIELAYQLQNQEGHPFARYQLEIPWG